jgi:uncharacterized protein YnzC (UPF0291/DUF896 family)
MRTFTLDKSKMPILLKVTVLDETGNTIISNTYPAVHSVLDDNILISNMNSVLNKRKLQTLTTEEENSLKTLIKNNYS